MRLTRKRLPHLLFVVAVAAGVGTADATRVHLHHLVSGIVGAAIRLRGDDPFAVQRVQAATGPAVDAIVDESMSTIGASLASLPSTTGPAAELAAERHARADSRLFRS